MGRKGSPAPTHNLRQPPRHASPSLSSPRQATAARQREENFRRFPPASRGGKNKKNFSINSSRLQSIGNHTPTPACTRIPPAPTIIHTGLMGSEITRGYFGGVGPFPEWSSHGGRGDHSDLPAPGTPSQSPGANRWTRSALGRECGRVLHPARQLQSGKCLRTRTPARSAC